MPALPLPAPPAEAAFTVLPVTRQEVPLWYHVYSTQRFSQTHARSFAQGWGDTRFAPIEHAPGEPVHTYYAASDRQACYMESVLHDVVLQPPGMFEVDTLRHLHLVTLRLPPSVACVQFHTPFLPALGLSRAQLVDSLPAQYPQTRAWAQAAYAQCPQAQAIAYGSRRHDAGRCLMLFKQRLPDPPFEVLAEEPLAVGPRRAELLALVRALKLHEV
ncbi:RES family NAD+ phosphorylase [Ideonella azotifigens]|uniref:RES domain-containing protein n=1 Tax=Ideonella azotifigens TaxID=513160 RepID=A0ABN1K2D8_9BURK|nr:RES family NAD+ phosphorylase [Ideonella azotifigens]MCD2343832.1 RES family NAD+ phosphorylase [Ideonella azotifigens]